MNRSGVVDGLACLSKKRFSCLLDPVRAIYVHRLMCLLASVFLVGFAVLLPAAHASAAANGRITGMVTDAATGESLPGANLVIEGTSQGTATDADGRYLIAPVAPGTYMLVVTYIGYQRKLVPVTVGDGESVTLNIELAFEAIEGTEVVITAQVEGQVAAINQQLSSNTITNVVSKARIQELPDVNAAESVGRLPGVSILRSGGEATQIAIRGLSPKYNSVTVNGVRVPSTGSNDRSVDLSLISSNMLDGIEVMKALTADKDADAIGGSVDLKLREAPETPLADLLVQGGYNQLQDYYGNYKVSGSVGRRFFGNRLGAIVSFSADEYDRSSDTFSGNYRQQGEGDAAVALIQRIDLRELAQTRGRIGGSMLLDYRIPYGKAVVNGFYNQLSGNQAFRSNNFDLENQRHIYALADNDGTTSIGTMAFNVEQTFNRFGYDIGIARTASERKNPANYYWDFMEEGAYDTDAVPENPAPIDIPAAFYNDLDNTYFLNFSVTDILSEEDETTAQMNVKVPFQFGRRVSGYLKTGGKLRRMERTNDQNSFGQGLFYGGSQGLRNVLAEALPELGVEVGDNRVPLEPFLDDYSRENFLDGDYDIGYPINPDLAAQVTKTLEEFWLENQSASRRQDYSGEERLRAGYVMAEFNLGQRLTFLPGIRWEHEESEYNGQFVREVGSGQTPVAIDTTTIRDNTFALPMVHLRVKPTSWLDLRLAYTETLTRPDYFQYAPITFVNQFGTWVQAGNPSLTPAKSVNLDASLSIYHNKIGLLTVSAYQKTIDNLIVSVGFPMLDEQQILPDLDVPGLSGVPNVSSAVNNPFDAKVRGIELDWQTNFWYLPSFLKGIVVGFNYTRVTSEIEVPRYLLERERLPAPPFFLNTVKDTSRVGRLPNQPKHIANMMVGYDLKGFSVRLSMLYQTNALSFFGNTPVDDRFTDDYVRWDLSVKQDFFWGLQFFANFNNLNARPDRDFRAELGASPAFIEYYGFTTDIGVRYRY